ncbi:MAG: hypothetical protein R3360_03100, partial [Alphaproteobacteria bacterium]|nr:hypothetical protein [Alphaproteobacteria bacterium]
RGTEASRAAEQPSHRHVVRDLVTYLADRLQASEIYNQVVAEIEAILRQRPIQVEDVKAMITHLAKAQSQGAPLEGIASDKANRLAAALYAPSPLSAGDPGIASYKAQIEAAEWEALRNEARACASLMHETGLVSAYQAVLVRHLAHHDPEMLPDALGLSDLGRQSYLCYRELTLALIENGVFPEYPQGVFGLTGILERGVLFFQPVAPALWRHLSLKIRPEVAEKISVVFGPSPSPEAHLLAGIMCVLGQPLGVGQGNNPTCQSARAITLYAQNGPDYLLQLLCWAVRDGEIVMTFEGDAISSGELSAGLAQVLDMALDPVSLVLVPHLDRIYAEMGRRTIGRPGDGHAWINPEFHGWWNNRGCRLLIDIGSGAVFDFDGFVRHFYATYHPFYNGGQPVIHGQPAGIAATTSTGDHIGWHAISIQRVALDPEGEMRVYFHDPNNEGRQDWGGDVETSTEGHGEIPGESSLPVAHFASRLYLFHYDPLEEGDPTIVPAEDVEQVAELARKSWAGQREWI